MSKESVAVKFDGVSFEYPDGKVTLDEASFTLRQGAKVALMGQNGAGKTTLFNLIQSQMKPTSGRMLITEGQSIACSQQVIPRDQLTLSVRDFFAVYFHGEDYNLDRSIEEVLKAVDLSIDSASLVEQFSGGQQARLLLASALIQDPDILLLDEPTNNLDAEGIGHLMMFLMSYEKTCIVISHDADFLNTFTDGVLYLDVWTQKIEQYVGDYYTVVEEIKARVEKERMENARYEKEIRDNKEKANYFANKGGKMRLVARKMRDKAQEMEESKVQVRREDKPIRPFEIPLQEDIGGDIITIDTVSIMVDGAPTERSVEMRLQKNEHLHLIGPNGIGKTTLLEKLAHADGKGATIADGVRVGYYRQDFSTLDFDQTVFEALMSVMREKDEEVMRRIASGFLITRQLMDTKILHLSEGQKGLVALAQLTLLEPGLLILDEPTNHINFRHVPIIAEALDAYKGPMIIVSHVDHFVEQIRIDHTLDLGTLAQK